MKTGGISDSQASNGVPAQDLPKRLLSAVHGRWRWATTLAVILSVTAGGFGWHAGKRLYASRVEFDLNSQTEDYGLDPTSNPNPQNYDSFADMQVQSLKSTRLLDRAMDDEAWRSLHRGLGDTAVMAFANRLVATRKDEVISVEFRDEDPNAAMVGVKAVVDAYQQLDAEEETQRIKADIDFLNSQFSESSAALEHLNEKITETMRTSGYDNFSPDDLLTLLTQKLSEVSTQQMRLVDARRSCELAQTQLDAAEGSADPNPDPSTAVPGSHPATKPVLRTNWQELQIMAASESLKKAKLEEQQLVAICKNENDELATLARLKRDVEDLRDQVAKEREKRDHIKNAVDARNRLARAPGRVRVLIPAEKPSEPATDTRPVYASLGAAGGIGLGFGAFVLIGLLDRRIRGLADFRLACQQADILGLLPQLPEDLVDPDQAEEAIRCVHHIRTRLQLWYGDKPQMVLAITSPLAGGGKTSLTLALGVSFAAAQSRTLLIDFDLGGGGLTARVRATKRRKIGQVLQLGGKLEDGQIDAALRTASDSGIRVGEALVQMGYVKEADLAHALDTQQRNRVGLLEALGGETLNDCVFQCDVPNLSLLPLGEAVLNDGGRISPLAIQRLIDAARTEYDVVLIDTGPLPGSVEASAAVAVADGVVLTVSVGQERQRLRESIDHLSLVGARLAGVVLNRATSQDLSQLRLGSGKGSASRPEQDSADGNGTHDSTQRTYGPFGHAHSVASGKRP